jgi:hypothetical protein
MVAKAVELNIKGIKCDHCDYKEPNVKFEEYEQFLNKPCPKCGENLLTEADLNSVKMMIQLTDVANEMFPSGFDGDDSKVPEFDKKIKAAVEMDGTGKMNIKVENDD